MSENTPSPTTKTAPIEVPHNEDECPFIHQRPSNAREQLGERIYNWALTYFPSHTVRQGWLRFFGATIGEKSSIMMGTKVLGVQTLNIGNNCSIGFRCLLDARGGLTIDDDVVLASDVQIITGHHVVDSDDFHGHYIPVHLGHHVWVASRSMVLDGVTIGDGAVVGGSSLVRNDVPDMTIVAGIPAKPRGKRESQLTYHPDYRPFLY